MFITRSYQSRGLANFRKGRTGGIALYQLSNITKRKADISPIAAEIGRVRSTFGEVDSRLKRSGTRLSSSPVKL